VNAFACEMVAQHGTRCTHQCEECADNPPYITADAIVRIFGMGHNAPRIVGLTESDDTPPRGVPAYHPTEAQPIRVGGPET